MGKKKKHIQTEKERLYQEEAAKNRAEKAERKAIQDRKTARLMLLFALIMFAVTAVFCGVNIAKMRNYELNYTRTYGRVTRIKSEHRTTSKGKNRTYYYLIFTYTINGGTFTATDWEGNGNYPDGYIGREIEIYVDMEHPERAARIATADGFSVMSVAAFVLAAMLYIIAMIMLLSKKGASIGKRVLVIWLPAVLVCCAIIALFWLGLPHDGFFAVFKRVRGAVGFAVVAGIIALVGAVDCFNARKR